METQKSKDRFLTGKWYIREDLCVEQFRTDIHSGKFLKYMEELGNYFESRQEAVKKANYIRGLIGAKQVK